MNLIVEKSNHVDYYTYLDTVFHKISEFRDLYWLISDLECNSSKDSKLCEGALINGQSLSEIVNNNKIQFIWAVLSGYKEKPSNMPKEMPYASNKNYWVGQPSPQDVRAEVEIVCWDSTYTLFINVSQIVASQLKELYPDIKDLNYENELRV